jgi:hypothetical protein
MRLHYFYQRLQMLPSLEETTELKKDWRECTFSIQRVEAKNIADFTDADATGSYF